MTQTRVSRPRFKRREPPPGIALTDDDLAILWTVYRHRLIDSQSIYRLFPNRSRQVISRRLRRLFDTDHLDRPLSQNHGNRLTPGTDHFIYALARLGARRLQKIDPQVPEPVRWTQKNAELKPLSIEHHMAITRFMTFAAERCAAHPDATLRYADEIIDHSQRPAGQGLANIIRADVKWHINGRSEGTAPDQIFALDVDDERQYFFLEIDEGSETVEPGDRRRRSMRFWRDTSLLRKFLIYSAAFRAGEHKRQFGIPVFRVLTVTTSPERIETMQEAYRNHLISGQNKTTPGLLLFTDWDALAASQDGLVVVNAAGRKVRLI